MIQIFKIKYISIKEVFVVGMHVSAKKNTIYYGKNKPESISELYNKKNSEFTFPGPKTWS